MFQHWADMDWNTGYWNLEYFALIYPNWFYDLFFTRASLPVKRVPKGLSNIKQFYPQRFGQRSEFLIECSSSAERTSKGCLLWRKKRKSNIMNSWPFVIYKQFGFSAPCSLIKVHYLVKRLSENRCKREVTAERVRESPDLNVAEVVG